MHANCRLRRIFFADKLYDSKDIPAEYKLFRKEDQLATSKIMDEFPYPPSYLGENEDMNEDEMGQGDFFNENLMPKYSADFLEMPAGGEDGGNENQENPEPDAAGGDDNEDQGDEP